MPDCDILTMLLRSWGPSGDRIITTYFRNASTGVGYCCGIQYYYSDNAYITSSCTEGYELSILNLVGANLTGSLSSSVGELTSLTVL